MGELLDAFQFSFALSNVTPQQLLMEAKHGDAKAVMALLQSGAVDPSAPYAFRSYW